MEDTAIGTTDGAKEDVAIVMRGSKGWEGEKQLSGAQLEKGG